MVFHRGCARRRQGRVYRRLGTGPERYPAVDLYLLAHSNKYVSWVEPLPETLRRRIRFVYNTGCHNQKQGRTGSRARTPISAIRRESIPFFYFFCYGTGSTGPPGRAAITGNRGMEAKFHQAAWLSGGRFDAERVMRESRATRGKAELRLEDLP